MWRSQKHKPDQKRKIRTKIEGFTLSGHVPRLVGAPQLQRLKVRPVQRTYMSVSFVCCARRPDCDNLLLDLNLCQKTILLKFQFGLFYLSSCERDKHEVKHAACRFKRKLLYNKAPNRTDALSKPSTVPVVSSWMVFARSVNETWIVQKQNSSGPPL